jgi:hypothetical protein
MADRTLLIDEAANANSALETPAESPGVAILALGTTANMALGEFARSNPHLAPFLLGLDGERPSHPDDASFIVNNGGADDWARTLAWRTHPILAHDRLLAILGLAGQRGAGAGRQRCVGFPKYFSKRSVVVGRVNSMTRLASGRMTKANGGNFHVHCLLSIGGGTGSGCAFIALLDLLAEIRNVLPNAHIWLTLHVIGPSCFEGLSREQDAKMHRNALGFLRELSYLQHQANVRGFADSMDVPWDEQRLHLADEVIEYYGSDSRNSTFSMTETHGRVAQNLLAALDPAVSALRLDRDACNRHGRADLTPQHIVSNVQSWIVRIPPLLPRWYASSWLVQELKPLLAKADLSSLGGELQEAVDSLSPERMTGKVGAAFRQLGSGLIAEVKALDDARELSAFIANLERKLDRHRKLILQHFSVRTGQHLSDWLKEQSQRHDSLQALFAVVKHVSAKLAEAISRAKAKARHYELAMGDGPVAKRGLFRSSNGVLPYVQNSVSACQHRTAADVLALCLAGIRTRLEFLQSLGHALLSAAAKEKAQVAEYEQTVANDPTSVVKAEEISKFASSMRVFLGDQGESLPSLTLAEVVEAGMALVRSRREHVEDAVRRQVGDESVTRLAAGLRLPFDLDSWIEETLHQLGGSAPLIPALIPDAEEETTRVIAAGLDFEKIQRFFDDNPRLAHKVQLKQTSQSGHVIVMRGFDHAPIEGMACYPQAERAEATFRRRYGEIDYSGPIPLDAVIASCGPLLPAHRPANSNKTPSSIDAEESQSSMPSRQMAQPLTNGSK